MKAFISLDKLFLLFFMCFGGISYGQFSPVPGGEGVHLVIEDLGDIQETCQLDGEDRVTFEFCIRIADNINGNEVPMYLGYTLDGNEYGPISIPFNSFIPDPDHHHHGILISCIVSEPFLAIGTNDCERSVLVELLTGDGEGNYSPYPVYDYADKKEIFDCNEFADIDCGSEQECFVPVNGVCPVFVAGELDFCCGAQFNGGGGIDFRNNNNENYSSSFIQNLIVQTSPNPFRSELQINYQLSTSEVVKIQLVDLSGRLVYQTEQRMEPGTHHKTIKTDQLNQGVFYLQLQTSSETQSVKLIKM